jgi:hypothetical protein
VPNIEALSHPAFTLSFFHAVYHRNIPVFSPLSYRKYFHAVGC